MNRQYFVDDIIREIKYEIFLKLHGQSTKVNMSEVNRFFNEKEKKQFPDAKIDYVEWYTKLLSYGLTNQEIMEKFIQ